jgi:hypothetical protein
MGRIEPVSTGQDGGSIAGFTPMPGVEFFCPFEKREVIGVVICKWISYLLHVGFLSRGRGDETNAPMGLPGPIGVLLSAS